MDGDLQGIEVAPGVGATSVRLTRRGWIASPVFVTPQPRKSLNSVFRFSLYGKQVGVKPGQALVWMVYL